MARRKGGWVLTASYVSDWIVLIIVAVVGFVIGDLTPNKRPFYLEDPDISFPYDLHETVPTWLLVVCSIVVPVVLIATIAVVLVPGATVPKGTPKSLVWKRKLWEMHTGWLGLALSLVSAWFITNGLKNLMGKPRPDLLSRCQPDVANVGAYVVGGIANISSNGQLVSAAICQNPDTSLVDDGFRSFPSGHSSFSAAGLVYLSLYIASKFAITIPFLAYSSSSPSTDPTAASLSAFPSRTNPFTPYSNEPDTYELSSPHRRSTHGAAGEVLDASSSPAALKRRLATHHYHHRRRAVAAAAAPPLYLLALAAVPALAAVFIASSRWFDFRHHGFDILFGFAIGTATAAFAFRYYHHLSSPAGGRAWGPRSADTAFWAGVGRSFGFAAEGRLVQGGGDEEEEEEEEEEVRAGDEEEALGGGGFGGGAGNGSGRGLGETVAVGRKSSRAESEA